MDQASAKDVVSRITDMEDSLGSRLHLVTGGCTGVAQPETCEATRWG